MFFPSTRYSSIFFFGVFTLFFWCVFVCVYFSPHPNRAKEFPARGSADQRLLGLSIGFRPPLRLRDPLQRGHFRKGAPGMYVYGLVIVLASRWQSRCRYG